MTKAFLARYYNSNHWIRFLPFLFVYIILVLLLQKKQLEGDEGRYLMYASNLLKGHYSPENEILIWNGPGYPILLMPFIALKTSWTIIRILNSLMIYISVVVLFKTFILLISERRALLFTICWAFYYIIFREMTKILTESFVILLLVLFQYYISIIFLKPKQTNKYVFIAGFLLGWIILTKIIFSYVMFLIILVSLCIWLFKRDTKTKKIFVIGVIALAVNLPYLMYTHHLTGRYFYWANSGGSSLYWASTPFKDEYGDWNTDDFTTYCGWDTLTPCNASFFAKNHEADFIGFRQLKGVEKDDAFKKKAIDNIKTFPLKYFTNCLANVGRMLFGLPQSYTHYKVKQIILMLPNIPIVFFIFFDMFVIFRKRIRLPIQLKLLFLFLLSYLCLSVLVSAEQRQFYIVVPFILLLTGFCTEQIRRQVRETSV